MAIVTRLETITPAKASKYLEMLAPNRPRSENFSRKLAGAIKNGEWKVNGETIKFNEAGQVEDGQHRLLAIVLADTKIDTFVTRGLPAGCFDTIDTGRRRSVGDVLARNGVPNYTTVAGALGWLWRFNRGSVEAGHRDSPRHAEAQLLLKEHPGIIDSASVVWPARTIMAASMAACLHYLFAKKDKDDAAEFFEALVSGENIAKSSPRTSGVYLLRNRLLDNRAAKARLPQDEIFPLVIKAWNAFRTKTVIKTLRWSTNGNNQEPMPEIK